MFVFSLKITTMYLCCEN